MGTTAPPMPQGLVGARRSAPLLSLSTDERLAEMVFDGSLSAFGVLFERYHAPLSRYCRSIVGNTDDAADAVQNTMVAALAGLERQTPHGPLKPWLYRIAHNEAINVMRRRHPNEQLVADIGERGDSEDQAEVAEQLADLFADLQTLPERQRGALVMRELSGLGYQEIADALSTSAISARKLVYEARVSLTEIDAGRSTACEEIQQHLSSCDGRSARARSVRAHLRDCPVCSNFAAGISSRREHLALVPALPAVGFAAALFSGAAGHPLLSVAKVNGAGAVDRMSHSVASGRAGRVTGAAAVGGAGAAGGGGALTSVGGALAVKCLAACALAAGTGALVVGQSLRSHRPAHSVVVQATAGPEAARLLGATAHPAAGVRAASSRQSAGPGGRAAAAHTVTLTVRLHSGAGSVAASSAVALGAASPGTAPVGPAPAGAAQPGAAATAGSPAATSTTPVTTTSVPAATVPTPTSIPVSSGYPSGSATTSTVPSGYGSGAGTGGSGHGYGAGVGTAGSGDGYGVGTGRPTAATSSADPSGVAGTLASAAAAASQASQAALTHADQTVSTALGAAGQAVSQASAIASTVESQVASTLNALFSRMAQTAPAAGAAGASGSAAGAGSTGF